MATGDPPAKKPRKEGLPATPISSIHVGQHAVTVRARLTNKSTFLPEDWDQYSFVELLDDTGEIRCGFTSVGEVGRRIASMKINCAYTITNLEVRAVNRELNKPYKIPIKRECELVLSTTSAITPDEEDSDLPHRQYDFTKIRQLREELKEKGCGDKFFDVIGVCVEIDLGVRCVGVMGDRFVRELSLVDDSVGPKPQDGFKLSLWGQPALRLTPQSAPETPFVVVMKRAGLDNFGGGRLSAGITKMPLILGPGMDESNPYLTKEKERLLDWYHGAKQKPK